MVTSAESLVPAVAPTNGVTVIVYWVSGSRPAKLQDRSSPAVSWLATGPPRSLSTTWKEVYAAPSTDHWAVAEVSVVEVCVIVAAPGPVVAEVEAGIPEPAAFTGTTVTLYSLAGESPVKVAVVPVTVWVAPPGSSVTS